MHVAVVPVLLGAGERLLEELAGYEVTRFVPSAAVVHYELRRR